MLYYLRIVQLWLLLVSDLFNASGKSLEITPALFSHHEFEALQELHLSRRGGPVFSKLTPVERFENPVFQFESEVTKS